MIEERQELIEKREKFVIKLSEPNRVYEDDIEEIQMQWNAMYRKKETAEYERTRDKKYLLLVQPSQVGFVTSVLPV